MTCSIFQLFKVEFVTLISLKVPSGRSSSFFFRAAETLIDSSSGDGDSKQVKELQTELKETKDGEWSNLCWPHY